MGSLLVNVLPIIGTTKLFLRGRAIFILMSTFIHGKELRLYKVSSGFGNQEVGCSTDCEIDMATDMREVTNYQSAKFKEFKPNTNQWNVSTSGLITIGSYDYAAMVRDWVAQTPITLIFNIDGGALGSTQLTGTAYINAVKLAGSNGAVATYAISFMGSGILNVTSTIIPPSTSNDVTRFEYTAVGGELSVTDAVLLNKNAVVSVLRGGTDIGNIKISGTPIGEEKKYVSATGTVSWAVDRPAAVGEYFAILWK